MDASLSNEKDPTMSAPPCPSGSTTKQVSGSSVLIWSEYIFPPRLSRLGEVRIDHAKPGCPIGVGTVVSFGEQAFDNLPTLAISSDTFLAENGTATLASIRVLH
jgi:hypothetical protein